MTASRGVGLDKGEEGPYYYENEHIKAALIQNLKLISSWKICVPVRIFCYENTRNFNKEPFAFELSEVGIYVALCHVLHKDLVRDQQMAEYQSQLPLFTVCRDKTYYYRNSVKIAFLLSAEYHYFPVNIHVNYISHCYMSRLV